MFEQTREAAFHQVVSSVKFSEYLPNQVFKGDVSEFRFFESDRMFAPSFVDVVGELMSIEKSTSSCLLNISRVVVPTYREAPAIFFDSGMTGAEFDLQLRRGGPATGWLFSMDHYGCASDCGNWTIYCEKDNDVAVAALRGRGAAETFSAPMKKLHAEAVDALARQGSAAPFPFNSLVLSWRSGLSSWYGAQAL